MGPPFHSTPGLQFVLRRCRWTIEMKLRRIIPGQVLNLDQLHYIARGTNNKTPVHHQHGTSTFVRSATPMGASQQAEDEDLDSASDGRVVIQTSIVLVFHFHVPLCNERGPHQTSRQLVGCWMVLHTLVLQLLSRVLPTNRTRTITRPENSAPQFIVL